MNIGLLTNFNLHLSRVGGGINSLPSTKFLLLSYLQRSVTGGLGSIQAETMADTAVALASANVQLVSSKVIGRLCRVRIE